MDIPSDIRGRHTRAVPSREHAPGSRPAPVVVGVDALGRSTSAVVWAAEEAERTGAALHLVHAGQNRVDGPLAAGAASLARRLTMSDLTCRVVPGRAADVLVEAAGSASLLVVGRRWLRGAQRLLSGSTSFSLAVRSPVPVVVVPEQWMQPSMSSAPIVVGVPPDPGEQPRAGEVLDFAAARADRLRVPLVVVGAWDASSISAWSPVDVAAARVRHEQALDRQVARVRRASPDLEIALRAVTEPAGQALLGVAEVGQLTVVGRRRRRGGRSLGSTARDVLHGSRRPVAVVPEAVEPDPPPDVPSWAPMF